MQSVGGHTVSVCRFPLRVAVSRPYNPHVNEGTEYKLQEYVLIIKD